LFPPAFGSRKIVILFAHALDEIKTNNNRGVAHRNRLIIHLHLPVLTGVAVTKHVVEIPQNRPGTWTPVLHTTVPPLALWSERRFVLTSTGTTNLGSGDTTWQIADG
jgi:hypothetical protein